MISLTGLDKNEGSLAIRGRLKVAQFKLANEDLPPRFEPKVHLRYFSVDGVAETIRHVMALGGIEWTESAWAVDFKKIDFKNTAQTLPIASPGFAAAKNAGELDANMGRAPVIVVDDKIEIGQSKTIEARALSHRPHKSRSQ